MSYSDHQTDAFQYMFTRFIIVEFTNQNRPSITRMYVSKYEYEGTIQICLN